jgi:hypothetical protein
MYPAAPGSLQATQLASESPSPPCMRPRPRLLTILPCTAQSEHACAACGKVGADKKCLLAAGGGGQEVLEVQGGLLLLRCV